MSSPVGLKSLDARVDQLHDEYVAARPFPHVVIDDLLVASAADSAYDKFDAIDEGALGSSCGRPT